MFVISTFRGLEQKDHKFEASLGCIAGHSLKIKLTGKQRMKERKKNKGRKRMRRGEEERGKGRGREHPFAC